MRVAIPENIVEAVAMGTGMFDCVMPTHMHITAIKHLCAISAKQSRKSDSAHSVRISTVCEVKRFQPDLWQTP